MVGSSAPFRIHKSLNAYHGGFYSISGTVSELGVTGEYKVVLFDRASYLPCQKVTSGSDGSYVFRNVALKEFFIVAFDHGDDPVNAAISDYVTPEPM